MLADDKIPHDLAPITDTTCTPHPEFTEDSTPVMPTPPVLQCAGTSKLGTEKSAGTTHLIGGSTEGTTHLIGSSTEGTAHLIGGSTAQLFKMLSVETDLNIPPENWLRGEVGERGKKGEKTVRCNTKVENSRIRTSCNGNEVNII